MKIVTIGGGTGQYNMLKAIKDLPNIQLSAIVSMSDDGGSTGKLRDEYGILPPGDLRRAIVALSDENKNHILRDIFNYRFKNGQFQGHNLGNIIMMAIENITGDYGKAVDILEELFDIKGKVYPVSFEKTTLLAQLADGKYILGESNIDVPKHNGNIAIKRLFVIKENYGKILKAVFSNSFDEEITTYLIKKFTYDIPKENPKIKTILKDADYIIFSPGDLYTSILPNILVGDIKNYILSSKAKKILFINLFTKFGETNGFLVGDYIEIFKQYFEKDIFDYIIIHDWDKYPIPKKILKNYKDEGKEPILNNISDSRIIKADLIKKTDIARHDFEKVKNVLSDMIFVKRR